jgi:hypothetical protein
MSVRDFSIMFLQKFLDLFVCEDHPDYRQSLHDEEEKNKKGRHLHPRAITKSVVIVMKENVKTRRNLRVLNFI